MDQIAFRFAHSGRNAHLAGVQPGNDHIATRPLEAGNAIDRMSPAQVAA
ncbi:MAG: hypothetical protein KAF27_02210 [Porphyrobacter sp.]|nr:hypothetical protein [Porphyrobacter sp.]